MAKDIERDRHDYIARAFAFLTLVLALAALLFAFRAHNIANTALKKANDTAKSVQATPAPAPASADAPKELNDATTPGDDSVPSSTGTGPGSANSLLGQ